MGITRIVCLAVACIAFLAAGPSYGADAKKGPAKGVAGNRKSAEKPKEDDGKVGYSTAEIQLNGIMAPYRTSSGITYQPLTIRLQLAPGDNQRPACFLAPIVHEKILLYLHSAKLEAADFVGQRRDVLAKNLLDIAVQTTDRGYYTGVLLVDETTPAMETKSVTLSSQCRGP